MLPYSLNTALQWRHNGRDSVSNHQPHDCLLNRLFRRRSKKTPKLRFTGFTGDRWIPRTNGHLRGKCFHLMTSSCPPPNTRRFRSLLCFAVVWYWSTSSISFRITSLTPWNPFTNMDYRKLSNIRRTKSPNLYVSRLGMQLSLCNILKPSVKWSMKM